MDTLSKSDIKQLENLIYKKQEGLSVDFTVSAFGLGFGMVLSWFAYNEAQDIWWYTLVLMFVPVLYSSLSYINYLRGIKPFKADIADNEKSTLEATIDAIGNRTEGYTLPLAQFNTLNKTYKSFRYFVRAGDYMFSQKIRVLLKVFGKMKGYCWRLHHIRNTY